MTVFVPRSNNISTNRDPHNPELPVTKAVASVDGEPNPGALPLRESARASLLGEDLPPRPSSPNTMVRSGSVLVAGILGRKEVHVDNFEFAGVSRQLLHTLDRTLWQTS